MGRKFLSVILTAWILLTMPVTALAQSFDASRTGSISVTLLDQQKTPIAGAELSLYYVATVSLNENDRLSYAFTKEFQNCGCALDDPALTTKLDAFVKDPSVTPVKLVTDDKGNVSFKNLALGLYFVKQTEAVKGFAPCRSFLVTVPNYNTDGYVYDVDASPKTDVEKFMDITIKKVWNTGSASKAADKVTVQLLKDGTVVKTATLNEQNSWQITYYDMPQSDGYTIEETEIPKGFTATYSHNGNVFTVTNSASLAQTGQLIWPIPVLALCGLFLIAVGILVLRKSRKQNG